jgi:hypothetical protein
LTLPAARDLVLRMRDDASYHPIIVVSLGWDRADFEEYFTYDSVGRSLKLWIVEPHGLRRVDNGGRGSLRGVIVLAKDKYSAEATAHVCWLGAAADPALMAREITGPFRDGTVLADGHFQLDATLIVKD